MKMADIGHVVGKNMDGKAKKMEPGGFEPPCRDSHIAASTRVFRLLISACETATDNMPARPAPGVFLSARPVAPRADQLEVIEPRGIERPTRLGLPYLGGQSVAICVS